MLSLGIAAVMIGLAIVAVTQRDRARSEERRAQEQLIESKLQQGGALIGAERWQEGLAAFDRARSLMQELGMPRLPLALKMVEAWWKAYGLSPRPSTKSHQERTP